MADELRNRFLEFCRQEMAFEPADWQVEVAAHWLSGRRTCIYRGRRWGRGVLLRAIEEFGSRRDGPTEPMWQ